MRTKKVPILALIGLLAILAVSTHTQAAPTSSKILFTSDRDGNHDIYVMDAVDANGDGNGDNQRRLTNNPAQDSGPVWSPDGMRAAFYSNRNGNFDIYVMDLVDADNDGNGDNLTRLTNNTIGDFSPAWSPDGNKIVFTSNRDRRNEIYVMNIDGTNQTRLTTNPGNAAATWSPDGTKIAFFSSRDAGRNEIYVMNADGSNQTRITNVPGQDRYPDWSPDGTKIVFTSTRTGSSEVALEIFVMNADGSSQTRLTNNAARDLLPDWSPDGTKIAFYSERDGDFDIYVMDAVDVDSDGNGDNLIRLTANTTGDFEPDWRDVNQPPSVAADNATETVDEGQMASNTGTIGDPDGDTVTLTASVGEVTNNGNGTWSWSFTTSDGPAESQTVTINADDGNRGAAQASFPLTVNNVAPTVDAVLVPLDPVPLGTAIGVSGTFSDPAGTNDEPYGCTANYGDGTGNQAGSVAGAACTGPSHTYAGPGVYTVSVDVTDKDGATGTAQATAFIVVYDPSGGFVTGGGWIDSPEDACPVFCGGAAGKANFGFVSKYKKGATFPTGQTEFNFKAGGLNFHSSSYEWLVVAGAKAMYKGIGTINGTGSYAFQINAIDGQVNGGGVDKFRIKIKMAGGGVIYDNQPGAGDNDDPTTALGGGSIKIHKAK